MLEKLIKELSKYPKDLFIFIPGIEGGFILGNVKYKVSDNGTPYLIAIPED